jgi:hypothetical protein
VLLQKYIKPLTVSFIYMLEPVLGAVVAYIYLHETLSVYGYIGGALIVMGTIINTWGTAQPPTGEPAIQSASALYATHDQGFDTATSGLAGRNVLSRRQRLTRVGAYLLATPSYSLLCCCLGAMVAYKLGGFPPPAWSVLFHMGIQLPMYMQQEPAVILLLVAQSLSWFIAWVAMGMMGLLTAYRVLDRHLARQAPTPAQKAFNPRRVAAYAYSPVNRAKLQPAPQPDRRMRTDFVELMEKM